MAMHGVKGSSGFVLFSLSSTFGSQVARLLGPRSSCFLKRKWFCQFCHLNFLLRCIKGMRCGNSIFIVLCIEVHLFAPVKLFDEVSLSGAADTERISILLPAPLPPCGGNFSIAIIFLILLK